MSPVATCGIEASSEMRAAWVPFPAPGGPRITMSSGMALRLFEEALVVPHHHLRLHLAHRVERDADHDQDRRAPERTRVRLRDPAIADEEGRQRRDERQVDRARQRE